MKIEKKILYKKTNVIKSDDIDIRPQIASDVYEFIIPNAVANPFGIITHGLTVHQESVISRP